jgi:putative flippase GtrA
MERLKKIVTFRIARFSAAGLINTATNFAVLNVAFYVLHQNKFTSIVIATSCAIAVSFILNRSFVFKDKAQPTEKLARFVAVSVVGIFLVQNSVYALCIVLLRNHESGVIDVIKSITGYRVSNDFVDVNLSNLIASFGVMFWNYNGYKLFVFNGRRRGNEVSEAIGTEAA